MSDFKASFRAAAAQRGSTAPSKEQIRALKAQKQASKKEEAPISKTFNDSRSGQAHAVAASQATDPFAEGPGPASKVSVSSSAPAAAPSAAAIAKSAGLSGPKAALPQGFFADKAADAKARGEKLPDAKDKEEEFKQFQKLMDEQVKELVNKEAEEAEEEAEDREERDAIEQRAWMHHMEEIRQRKVLESTATVSADEVQRIALPARKRKVAEVLKGLVDGDDGDESSGADDLVLDWRAKGV